MITELDIATTKVSNLATDSNRRFLLSRILELLSMPNDKTGM